MAEEKQENKEEKKTKNTAKKTSEKEESEEKTSTKQASKQSKKPTQKEFEKKVVELAKQGMTNEKIGEELKKQDIHTKEYNKKISKILKENDLFQDPDLKNLQNKLERIKKHYENNKQDKRALRERDRIYAKIRKLRKSRYGTAK